jgi:hypothetical protein
MSGTPDYLLAADNHNILGSGASWLNPADWSVKFGNGAKLAATSILSGWNSFYNSGAMVGKWIGVDADQRDTQAYISGLDSDLGRYYQANAESADLIGFIGGAIIPGLGGVKAFNLGQVALKTALNDGLVGGNMARSLGVLIPRTEKYVALAGQEINASTNAVKLFNAQTYKALASGLWQNTLEAAAAETVIQATMFASPILDGQDVWDITSNIAIGGALGGAIGGAFSVAKIRGTLKDAVKAEDILRAPFIQRPAFGEGISRDEKIISLAYDSDMAAQPVILRGPTGEVVNNYAVTKNLYESKITKNSNEIRSTINSLVTSSDANDSLIGNILANMSTPIKGEFGYSQRYLENFYGAIEISRAGRLTKAETTFARQILKGETPEVLPTSRYVKVIGENVGSVTDSEPVLLSLGDLYNGRDAVRAQVKKEGFKLKDLWDAAKLSGKNAHLEAEKRYIWAKYFLPKIDDGTLIHRNDIPLLERAYEDSALNIKIVSGEGASLEVVTPTSRKEIYDILKESKIETANVLLKKMSLNGEIPIEQGTEAAAKIVNTRQAYLEGIQSADETADLFANKADYQRYLKSLEARGLSTDFTKAAEAIDPLFLPKYAKVVYDSKKGNVPATVTEAMVHFKEQQKLYADGSKRVVAKILGPASESLPDISDTALVNSNRLGAGPGLFSSENSNYGTLGSAMAWIGSVTRSAKENARKVLGKNLESSLVRLAQKPEAAIEFEGINQKISRSGKLWVEYVDPDRGNFLVSKDVLRKYAEKENLTGRFDERSVYGQLKVDMDLALDEAADEIIHIKLPETLAAVRDHISESGKRTIANSEIRAQQGHTNNYDPLVFRPIRPNLRQYPHFAFVRDPRVTGSGHVTMIHAASEKELTALIDKVPTEYRVLTKTDVEEFQQARGDYEFARTLNENYLDSSLKSKGVFSNFFPKSDPEKIVDDILQQHYRESDTLVMETVRLRYEPQFNFLEDLGKQYSRAETSRFASRSELIERTADNPYFNYIKTALDISKAPENRLIYGFNKSLDEAVSKAVGSIKETFFARVKSPADLDIINAQLDQHGIKPAYYDAALQALANHTAPRGELTKFVRRANSLLSLFTLGLDPLNALNNAIGSNILRMTELRHLTKAIASGDAKVAGELAGVAKINVPGVNSQMLAPTKLVSRAIGAYWKDDGTLRARYVADGIIKSRDDQLKMLVDDFTLKGTESVNDLESRLSAGLVKAKSLAEKGEKLTLNAQAEEFNRFISANVMDQITEIGVQNGLLDPAAARAYRNTFVNRVEGNILASQRPLVFQGPIGQAISLFQSYQFNLIQQLFRYVAEGSGKDLAMLAGLQSTLYGIQSLPAFQFINTHIIGQLSGNQQHKDTYDAVYGVAGRTAGDFFLYGLPSNILQTNIYSRGDINPRQLTILPTALQEIPIVNGWGKFFGSLYETAKKIGGGGNAWESILQGIEHNGISRPLAGFAQTLQAVPGGTVYSTSSKGSILYSNDLLSFATLSRLAGGRPIDEAVVNDALFRVKAYETAKRGQMQSLAETVKASLIQGNEPDEAQINQFAERYAASGGKQAGFNKWMMGLYKTANEAQSEKLARSLNNPFAYKMQLLMGGDDEE